MVTQTLRSVLRAPQTPREGTYYLVLGVDPGPTPGIAALLTDRTNCPPEQYKAVDIQQVPVHHDPSRILGVLDGIVDMYEPDVVVLGYERYVMSNRSVRARQKWAQKETVAMCAHLSSWTAMRGGQLKLSTHNAPAATVKRWASDVRLVASSLRGLSRGMPHARDATLVALWTGRKTGILADPLAQ